VVALMVGLLTFPLSLLADRFGRVKSLTAMAVMWSLATLLCALAGNYQQMLAGRILVGVGEAAYGSVGIAVVISVFPRHMRATLTAAFMAGGLAGQVLGVAAGGAIAAAHGWRWAFAAIALGGLAIAILYPIVVRERRIAAIASEADPGPAGQAAPLKSLVGSRSVRCAYIGSGLQLYVAGALPAWLPSYFSRYYALPLDKAAALAALFLIAIGAGMVLCGMLSDRLGAREPLLKIRLAIVYCLLSAGLTGIAFLLPAGPVQLAALGLAAFLAAATSGPAGAMVANLTPLALHGTAFATLTLANNLLGLAPGPILTGRLADAFGLQAALQVLPAASLAAALVFAIAARSYQSDLAGADRLPAPAAA
jgi:MFS family permease